METTMEPNTISIPIFVQCMCVS